MMWDEELERFTRRVERTLGSDALDAATERAIRNGKTEVRRLTSKKLPIPHSVFTEAFRAELKQLLRPH